MAEAAPVKAPSDTCVYNVKVNGNAYTVEVSESGEVSQVTSQAASQEKSAAPAPAGSGEAMPAPLAGNIWKINVNPGESVKEGDVMLILEAMKMETEVRAPRGGKISTVTVREGDSVAVGDTLLCLA